jgi:hypothetical protein
MPFAKKPKKAAPRLFAPRGPRLFAPRAFALGGGAKLSTGLLVRTLIVGLIAIGGAVWALDRHYTHVLPPMRVPVPPREAPAFDADAGEVPAPDFYKDDAAP